MADSESSESATIDVPSKATAFLAKLRGKPRRRPLGFGWRSSYWFTTFMVGLGVATDLLTYTIIIPVMPFHLEKLGCDVVPEAIVGRQLGIALSGLSLGKDTFSVVSIACIDGILRILIGPPVGGSLYAGFGYRAPFVFAMGAAVLDMIARLLIVERKDALNCGIDPKIYNVNIPKDSEKGLNQGRTSAETIPKSSIPGPSQPEGAEASREVIKLRHVTVDIAKEEGSSDSPSLTSRKPYTESTNLPRSPSPAPSTTSAELHSRAENLKIKPISLPVVIVRLSKSSRAVVSLLITFVYGYAPV
ncbi:hypothetical protein DXG03_004495 [Asterophora parasitica]|uniref:MFS general substrate transporter n=1 Tax=Asterophora parasitica TaxID=117018 RepID=A0A9P7GF85_9AGAR|nr:hypothetical protein DXG03_004495 [Asterophora parasitica]